ncbi:MAG: hypothetical protein QOG64_2006 [Acidimicrobiaceae bacterium]|jgi:AcrR family transcriptional regulator|nr:hypothetical protein [Acidimicrobiaceae bacterium]
MAPLASAARTRRTQAERRETTRAALLTAARALFAEHGFAGTGREQIAERAGVTRGALYHHFTSKEELFREVVEALDAETVDHLLAAARTSDIPAEQIRRGCHAYLDACLDPAFRRVALLEAPAVLGLERCREISARHCLGLLRLGLSTPGIPVPDGVSTEFLAHLLLGALNETAMAVAAAPDPGVARAEAAPAVDLLVDRLFGAGQPS